MPKIELIQGDCLEKMHDIPDGSIDMILCDLPYGTTACKWDVVIPFEPLWEQYKRIIKDRGAIVLFGSEPFSSYLRMSNIKNYRYDWIWHKNLSGSFATAKKMPMKYHENISVFYKKLPTYNPQFQPYAESVGKRFKDGEMVNRKKKTIPQILCKVDFLSRERNPLTQNEANTQKAYSFLSPNTQPTAKDFIPLKNPLHF